MRAVVFAVSAACIAALVSCTPNQRRDAHCTPDEASIADDPACIYAGDGKGPPIEEETCAPPTGAPPATCPTFDEIAELVRDVDRGNCTAGACHGSPTEPAVGIYFNSTDEIQLYGALTSAKGSIGTPYVVPDDPATPDNEALQSWMHCSVRGQPGGGFPMPTWSGLTDPADADLVDAWLLCGAPGPK